MERRSQHQDTVEAQRTHRPGNRFAVIGAAVAATMLVVALAAPMVAGAAGTTTEGRDGRRPIREWVQSLTEEQRQCLADHGVHRLHHRPTRADVARFRAAVDECGLEPPFPQWSAWVTDARAALRNATAEQKQCLRDEGIHRPRHRAHSWRQRRARIERFVAAAETCGIDLPPVPST